MEVCTLSEEGPELLHQLGVETHGLDPALTYVPHVMFNQVAGNHDPYSIHPLLFDQGKKLNLYFL